MFSLQKIKQQQRGGFTLIETLVFLFIFALISIVFLQSYVVGTKMVIESKNRLGATALANQKMEIIRSVAYSAIGTKHWSGSAWVYGIPPGDILEDENISVNTTLYHVHTFVQYVDDAFDGTLGGSTNDAVPNDYKKVRLTVSWGDQGADQSVASYANFSPKGIETPAGGGIFSINILDSVGGGVSGATVHVENAAASVNFTTSTSADGNVTLVGTPAGTEAYHLTISKSGYYGATTLAPYPTTAYSPTDVHASVVNGVLNQKTMVMDQSSDIHLVTKDAFGTDIPNVNFHIEGGRIMGVTPTLQTVYGLIQDSSTNASGEITLADQSYGPYKITFTNPLQYEFYKLNPEGVPVDTFTVNPGVTKEVTGTFLSKNIGSVKVTVKNNADASVVSGASVHLSNTTLGYDTTITTDQYGVAYFPTALPALVAGVYDLEVSAAGFSNNTSTVTIAGALVKTTISLNP